jgi:hypothetical protein
MGIKERRTGHGAGPVTIGSVVVPARWRYSYVAGEELPGERRSQEDFKLVITLALADRKKLVNLKKGDGTTVTVESLREMPVYLNEIDYDDGRSTVALTFTRTQPPPLNGKSEPA